MTTDNRVSICGRLVDEAIKNNWPATVLADILKDLGIRASGAADYIDELNQSKSVDEVVSRWARAKQTQTMRNGDF